MKRLLFLAFLLPIFVSGCATSGYVSKDEGDKGWITVDRTFNSGPVARDVAKNFCQGRGLSLYTYGYDDGSSGLDSRGGELYSFVCTSGRQGEVFLSLTADHRTQPIQQQNSEVERLRAEAEASRQRQRQLEEQLNQARQQPPPTQPVLPPKTDRLSLEQAKIKCVDYGRKPGTEAFGKCVLELLKQ